MIKVLNKVGIEGKYLNIIKVTYDGASANILNSEQQKAFTFLSGTRQGCLLSSLLFSVVLAVAARAARLAPSRKHPNWG